MSIFPEEQQVSTDLGSHFSEGNVSTGFMNEVFESERVNAATNKPFVCHLCGTSFARKQSLNDHLKGPQHEDEKPYSCNQCGKAYTRRGDLKRHESETHKGTKFVCSERLAAGERRGCGRRFTRALTLKSHQKHCEPFQMGDPNVKIPVWSRMTWASAEETMLRHKTAEVLFQAKTLGTKALECRVCHAQRLPDHIGSFIRHLVDHLESIMFGAYHCNLCGLSFGWDLHLQKHNEMCHGRTEPEVRCQVLNSPLQRSCRVHGADAKLLDEVVAGRQGSCCVVVCEQAFEQLKVRLTTQLEQCLGRMIEYEPKKPLKYLEAVRSQLRMVDPLTSLAPSDSLLEDAAPYNQEPEKENGQDTIEDDLNVIFGLRPSEIIAY